MFFPFLAMFRMAWVIFRLVYSSLIFGETIVLRTMLGVIGCVGNQLCEWMIWWTTLYLLWVTSLIGNITYPKYQSCLKYLDKTAFLSIHNRRSKRIMRDRRCQMLTLPGTLCVFTEIHNVYALNNAFANTFQVQKFNTI